MAVSSKGCDSGQITPSQSGDSLLDELVDEYLERLADGEPLTIEEYAQRYPNLAERIRETFPDPKFAGFLADLFPRNGSNTHDATEANYVEASASRHLPVGFRLGKFRIIQEIGRGGMGIVYLAEDETLVRNVAIKILPTASLLEPLQLERFKQEASAAAALSHANIIPVHEVGQAEKIHFYVMQFINGQTIAQMIRQLRYVEGIESRNEPEHLFTRHESGSLLDSRETAIESPNSALLDSESFEHEAVGTRRSKARRSIHIQHLERAKSSGYFQYAVRIIAQAAQALEFAHQQGVVHRDIKPSNIIVEPSGKAWIADFGLARIESDASLTLTASGALLGTLRYMSPEQAEGNGSLITHQVDIYSLGITLYELVCLQPAFSSEHPADLLWQVRQSEPPRPRYWNPAIPRDLETIILKSISKDPSDRYETSEDFVDDLQRFLKNEPPKAQRLSMVSTAFRWIDRNPRTFVITGLTALFVSIVISLMVVVSGMLITANATIQRNTAEIERARIEHEAREAARVHELYSELIRNWYAQFKLNPSGPFDLWAEPSTKVKYQAIKDVEWNYLSALASHPGRLFSNPTENVSFGVLAISTNQSLIAVGDHDGNCFVSGRWPSRDWQPLPKSKNEITAIAFSPDGRLLATSAATEGTVKYWSLVKGYWKLVREFKAHDRSINRLIFTSDGAQLITTSRDGRFRVWHCDTDELLFDQLADAESVLTCAALSPDGEYLATGGQDESVKLWNLRTASRVWQISDIKFKPLDLDFSPNGATLACVGYHDHLILIDAPQHRIISKSKLSGFGTQVAYSQTGQQLACSQNNGELTVFYLNQEQRSIVGSLTRRVDAKKSNQVSWLPGGKQVISCGDTGQVSSVVLPFLPDAFAFKENAKGTRRIQFSPNGNRVVAEAGYGSSLVVDQLRYEFAAIDQDINATPAIGFDVGQLVHGYSHGRTFNIRRTGLGAIPRSETIVVGLDAQSYALSENGRIAALAQDRLLEVWDVNVEVLLFDHMFEDKCRAVEISRNGERILVVAGQRLFVVRLTPQPEVELLTELGTGFDPNKVFPCFNREGDIIAARTGSWEISVWRGGGTPFQRISVPEASIEGIALSPTGRTLIVAGTSLTVWNVETGWYLGPLLHSIPDVKIYRSPVIAPGNDQLAAEAVTHQGKRLLMLWDFRQTAEAVPTNNEDSSPDEKKRHSPGATT